MRSSSGAHFIALDHVRAFAVFLVIAWHFTHATTGYPVPFEYVPALFPFAILDEGHTGVGLFMALSGYLFAKLLDGKSIDYKAFIWNRALRLLPLLVAIILFTAARKLVKGQDISSYAYSVVTGVVLPTLPHGGWSITVEFHYYLILPVFLWMLAKSRFWPLSIVVAAIALRALLLHERGEIQTLAYYTIIGRIDQFALGMLVYQFRAHFVRRHAVAAVTILAFMLVYWYFDRQGGFYLNPSYPSPSPFWIVLPTIEGVAYAVAIAWYDNSFSPSTSGISRFIGRIGEYSYSIYILHFSWVFTAAKFVDQKIMDISNFYLACLWSVAFLLFMVLPGYLSFRFIESPFLRLRKPYIKVAPGTGQSLQSARRSPPPQTARM